MATRIYTRTGDSGETGLLGGGRVRKDDLRVEACGAVDELNASIGLARSAAADLDLAAVLSRLQADLLVLGADLGVPAGAAEGSLSVAVPRTAAASVEAIERDIDRLAAELPILNRFILPGGTGLAAALHLSRVICRRAERRVVTLGHSEPVSAEALRYLNRLSDLLFVMARTANHRAGEPDVLWEP